MILTSGRHGFELEIRPGFALLRIGGWSGCLYMRREVFARVAGEPQVWTHREDSARAVNRNGRIGCLEWNASRRFRSGAAAAL